MDLGLKGKSAIVCASSRGLGRACAESLAAEGVNLVLNGRTEEVLVQTAAEISEQYGVSVQAIVADVTTEEGRDMILTASPTPDILINNAGGPKPGDFRGWSDEDWHNAVQANMVAPIQFIKAVLDGMIERKFGRIVNITSAAVRSPISNLGLSNGARAGLTGFVAGLARAHAEHNVTINNLLPGPFDTDRLRSNLQSVADAQGISLEEVWQARAQANPTGRFGSPEEFGQTCAFMCAAQSGYLNGQNILLDGGAFNSSF